MKRNCLVVVVTLGLLALFPLGLISGDKNRLAEVEQRLKKKYEGQLVTVGARGVPVMDLDEPSPLHIGFVPQAPRRVLIDRMVLTEDELKFWGRCLRYYTDGDKVVSFTEEKPKEYRIFSILKEGYRSGWAVDWEEVASGFLEPFDGQPVEYRDYHPTNQEDALSPEIYPRILTLGSDIKSPECIYCPDPVYTPAARENRISGKMVFWMVVDESGRVSGVRLHKGLGHGLNELTLGILSGWQFKPTERDGKPVRVKRTVEVGFRLY